MRPFGISTLITGFDPPAIPCLYQTEPSGASSAWKATAIGRNSKTVSEFLQKHYAEGDREAMVKLVVQALMESVEPSAKMIEVAVITAKEGLRVMSDDEVDAVIKGLEDEKAAADAAKKGTSS